MLSAPLYIATRLWPVATSCAGDPSLLCDLDSVLWPLASTYEKVHVHCSRGQPRPILELTSTAHVPTNKFSDSNRACHSAHEKSYYKMHRNYTTASGNNSVRPTVTVGQPPDASMMVHTRMFDESSLQKLTDPQQNPPSRPLMSYLYH